MKQLVESIAFFSVVTCQYIPIRKASKFMQAVIYITIFTLFFGYQVYEFTSSKSTQYR